MPKESQSHRLELAELLDRLSSPGEHAQNVEADLESTAHSQSSAWIKTRQGQGSAHRLAQRSALPNRDLVTLLHTKSRRAVRREVLVPLLVPGVLGDEVQILPADDERPVHLSGNNGAGEDTAPDRDKAGEGAFLV